MESSFRTFNFFQIINDLNKPFNIAFFLMHKIFLFHLVSLSFKLLVLCIFCNFNFIWIFLPPSLARRTTRFTDWSNFLNFLNRLLAWNLVLGFILWKVSIDLLNMVHILVHRLIHKIINSKNNHNLRIWYWVWRKSFFNFSKSPKIYFIVKMHFWWNTPLTLSNWILLS